MIYTLTTPVTVGDLNNQIILDKLELSSISLNFEPTYKDKGIAILSIVLIHRASGHTVNIVYSDTSALGFWANLDTASNLVTKAAFAKMAADGKLPAGILA
jgi:hypothetical protein